MLIYLKKTSTDGALYVCYYVLRLIPENTCVYCGKRGVFTFTISPRSFGKSNRHTYWLLYYYLLSPGDAMTIRETMTEPHPAPSPKGEGSEYNKAEALSVENLGRNLSSAM
jgi:hypothetical protein